MALNGTAILLLVEGQVVGSQREVTLTETTEAVDVSNNERRQRRVIPGMYGAQVDLDALYVPDDLAYGLLRQAIRGHGIVEIQRVEEGSVVASADALITALSGRAPDQGEATFGAALTLSGAWITVAGYLALETGDWLLLETGGGVELE